ncbi:MAG TPA: hypothetical protein VH230_11485 [Stellaceae bacterium]|jgi:hypothetical protein|nr:hypothetical protein [Stellaceae bacterium]
MKPTNLLFILSDEHNPRVLGCAGHPMRFAPQAARAEIVAMVAQMEHPRMIGETGRGERVDEFADIVEV